MTVADPRLIKAFRRVDARRSHELAASGMSRSQISRLVADGRLVRVMRGLYALPGSSTSAHVALTTVARRKPGVLFCLLTALRFHELTTQAPFEVWIAISNKAHPPRIDYPPLRVVRFSTESMRAGVETHTVDGTRIRVTSVAKTVADCFKFRGKVGLDVALEALREARRTKKATADELWRCAQVDRVANVMRPYLEAIA
jgi:predicted transcriptional regulator of viral defense system